MKKSTKKARSTRKTGVNLECEVAVVADLDVDARHHDKGGRIGGEGELADVAELPAWGHDLNDGGRLVGVNPGPLNHRRPVGKVFELVGDGLRVLRVDRNDDVSLRGKEVVHCVVGNQHPNQGVDDPAGAKDQGGDQEDDPVDDVGNRTNVTVELLLQVSGDDVNPPGGKAAVEAQADSGPNQDPTDNRVG